MSELAILGGTPVLNFELRPYQSMGQAEEEAVRDVVRSGCLSGFYGSEGPEFLGGPKVREFEQAWCKQFDVAHCVSVNSATSGLIAAMGAIGICPGDEVIVPPWTMSATVMAPLFYGGIPVFADIESDTFGLDPAEVRKQITSKTKAIIAVNLFGHPARLAELKALADENGIWLIEDNAQAPLSHEHGIPTGTIGDIGVASLNFHKHIHTGEGGMCVTNNPKLATRLQLIRNHGENVTNILEDGDITNIIGMNLRMTEMSAAIGLVQLSDIETHISNREKIAEMLSRETRDLPGWKVPIVRTDCRHNYYVWLAKYDQDIIGISRDLFSKALTAEGFPNFTAYLAPLYRLPVFQQRMAFGREGYPFNLTQQDYSNISCPVTERMHEKEAVLFEPCAFDINDETANLLVEAIRKVYRHRNELNARQGETS